MARVRPMMRISPRRSAKPFALPAAPMRATTRARAGVRLGTLSVQPVKPLLGVNEASGEFGVGAPFFKYAYPGKDRIDWAAEQGFGIIRVPFLFQNIQATSGAPLNEGAMRQLDP